MGTFILMLISYLAGSIVAWNFLEQPEWLAKRFKKSETTKGGSSGGGGSNENTHLK